MSFQTSFLLEPLLFEVASGMRVGVRAAGFQVGGDGRSAVTLSIAVPDSFAQPADGGTSATILLTPMKPGGSASG